jgi:uncharacterized protein (TIGR02231 family)
MKTKVSFRLLSTATFGLFAFNALYAAPQPVTSAISAATVYTDRAIVTRTVALDLAAGEHELVFENLPTALMDESLQVTAKGTARATVLDVNARTTFVAATPDARVKDLEDQIKKLAQERRSLDDRGTVLAQKRDYLLKIQTATTTVPNVEKETNATRTSVDDWLKLLKFSEDNLAAIAAELRTLDVQRQDLQEKQTALQRQLDDLRNGREPGVLASGSTIRPMPNRDRNVKTVTVRLAVSAPGALSLSLAYGVRGASWSPAYDVRLHAAGKEPGIDLSYFGTVRQNTGEDWKNVALTLSTARPSLGGAAPALRQWVLDEARPQPVFAAAPAPGGGGRGGRGGAALAAAPAASQSFARAANESADGLARDAIADMAVATVETGLTSASYKIPTTATILSDNTPQKVGIASVPLGAKLQYQATPRLVETAYLSASVANSSDYVFLAGPMNTFLDDSFVATSALKTTMPGEKFDLSLGADEGIAIKRKVIPRYTEQTGFSNGGVRVTYAYEITITNNKTATAHVVFKELLPKSQNEKIVVKLVEPRESDVGTPDKPGKEVTMEEDNKLVWRVNVEPGKAKERKFTLKFTVDYPKDFNISGLE